MEEKIKLPSGKDYVPFKQTVVRDLKVDGKVPMDINLRMISEERDVVCVSCMRIVKAQIFSLVYVEEPFTKNPLALMYFYGAPTAEKPFICRECHDKKEKSNGADK